MIIKTICNLCNNFCGLDVHVEDGRVVRVRGMAEHPLHTPWVKPQGLVDLVYSTERIIKPAAEGKQWLGGDLLGRGARHYRPEVGSD